MKNHIEKQVAGLEKVYTTIKETSSKIFYLEFIHESQINLTSQTDHCKKFT